MRGGSAAGARTQYRQLIDLLGSARGAGHGALTAEAGFRLAKLVDVIPPDEQSRILREPGQRLRNPDLVEALAWCDPQPAAAAMATARLTDAEWCDLIPQLPVMARGFLRHRRDLPRGAQGLLEQLGVHDLTLTGEQAPEPRRAAAKAAREAARSTPQTAPQPARRAPSPAQTASEPISALLDRIARYSETRRSALYSPRLPLGDTPATERSAQPETISFFTDTDGTVTHATPAMAPWLTGMSLLHPRGSALLDRDERLTRLLRQRQPLRDAMISIDAAPAISGEWQLDAIPVFAESTGAFTGYRGALRRPSRPAEQLDPATARAEQMRQVLHELRTPVGAIQGFAEIIQQQMLGAVPHEYRAHAAAISVDAAKLLAGFDEVDRLVKLETQAMALEDGEADFRLAVHDTIQRLRSVLEKRDAGFDFTVSGSPFTTALARSEALALCWRILATATGALGAGEKVALTLHGTGASIDLRLELPQALRGLDEDKPGTPPRRQVVTAGMFGPRFAFRLASAEASAAGGELACDGEALTLSLPCREASGTNSEQGAQLAGK